ncbi:MAG: hypothetical protein QOF61_2419, partial [Acidobacteriota bacterium]|nr:hypothetical protein [Acidobacteriota bacterium]
ARHGLAWYEIDVNWWGIRTLELLGLAKAVKLAPPQKSHAAAPAEVESPNLEPLLD